MKPIINSKTGFFSSFNKLAIKGMGLIAFASLSIPSTLQAQETEAQKPSIPVLDGSLV